jgi:hypothetical protein
MPIRSSTRYRPTLLLRLKRLMRLMRSQVRRKPPRKKWQPILSLEAGACLAEPASAPAPSQDTRERIALGQELTRTLDRHAMSRSVMPALALLERALSATSDRGETRLAAPVLWDAINHINMLSDSWQGGGLQTLRRRLIAALGMDEADVDVLCASNDSFQVQDARLSDFMQVMDQWTGSLDAEGSRRPDPATH